jgi:lysophospholipase L1-like esterase
MPRKTLLKRPAYIGILAALAMTATFLIVRPALPAQAATPVRVMPLGDSITGSPGCWRALLWNRLQSNGFTNIDFVGTQPPQGCAVAYDGDNEGHGGALATMVANQNQLPGWLSATKPDIVLMHFGTNDVWSNIAPATILTAFSTLVDQMRASNPTMKILVAQIIAMNPSSCPECAQRVVAFNAAIPGWASGKSTSQSPITVVDQWTGFNTATDTGDGVHPNDAGNQKMSDRWYPALAAQLTPGSSPSVSVSPSNTASSSPSSGTPRCGATYQILNQWQGGFQGTVTITNTGTVPITGWTTQFTFANGQQITQSWSATVSQLAATVTASNLSWNGSLSPAASTWFGFLATVTGTNTAPAPTCVAS